MLLIPSDHQAILGPAKAGRAKFVPEPEEAWLAVLAASVPFRSDAAVVTLDDGPESRGPHLRASKHFSRCHLCPLRTGLSSSTTTGAVSSSDDADHHPDAKIVQASIPPDVAAKEARRRRRENRASQSSLPPPSAASVVGAGREETAVQVALRAASTLDRVPANSLDVLCFAPATVRNVLPWASHVVSEAAMRLRPHGVLSIMAQPRGQLIGPDAIVNDFEEFARSLPPNDDRESEADGFTELDAQLPFSSIQRRWLWSEYELRSIDDLESYVRTWPEYLAAVTPVPDDTTPGVLRHRSADPMKALSDSIAAFVRKERGRGCDGRDLTGVVRLQVPCCVITCDNRRINRDPLPGTGGAFSAIAANTIRLGGNLPARTGRP